MPSRPPAPFAPAGDAGPRRRSHDPGAVDIAPDDVSLLGARQPGHTRSPEDLAMYGYAGQGYPIYGQPNPGGAPGQEAPAHPSFLRGGREPVERESEPRREREQDLPWLADPAGSAFAFGYTTSLGASPPQRSGRGGQAGKGPKDYLRADSRVFEDVCDRLSDDDAVDASEISVEVSAGVVTLSGAVLDRHCKRRAEELCARVRGVVDIRNHLQVHKGLLRELGDALGGGADAEHHGHHGSGTRQSG
jgi:BON domain